MSGGCRVRRAGSGERAARTGAQLTESRGPYGRGVGLGVGLHGASLRGWSPSGPGRHGRIRLPRRRPTAVAQHVRVRRHRLRTDLLRRRPNARRRWAGRLLRVAARPSRHAEKSAKFKSRPVDRHCQQGRDKSSTCTASRARSVEGMRSVNRRSKSAAPAGFSPSGDARGLCPNHSTR